MAVSRYILGVCFVVALWGAAECLGAGAQAQTAAPSLEALSAWEGKYPWDPVNGNSLLNQQPLQAALLNVLGPNRYEIFERRMLSGPSVPIEMRNGVMLVSFCQAHACDTDFVRLFITPNTGALAVCWAESEGATQRGFWIALGQIRPVDCTAAEAWSLWQTYGATP